MPYSAAQMFALVADVKSYPEFLPWVAATRIKSDSETEMIADMVVGFSAFREKFTSLVKKQKNQSIEIEYLDGPLQKLHNDWTFEDDGQGGCIVGFYVEFAFKSVLLERMARQFFDHALISMINAFEKRAEKLYSDPSGSSSSSAHSAA